MDIKEKRKQYYINNRDRILEQSKKYYYDHIEQRKEYNNKYWSLNGYKYIERRRNDDEYKAKQSQYYKIYREEHKIERQKQKLKNNSFNETSQNYFLVSFSF